MPPLRNELRSGELVALCDAQMQKKETEAVQEARRGTWKAGHLFTLKRALEFCEFYQQRIAEYGQQIEVVLREPAGTEPQDAAP